jgi:hypothetical protein
MLNWTRRIDGQPYEDIYVPSRPSHVNAKAWCDQFNGKKGDIAGLGIITAGNGQWMRDQSVNNLGGTGFQPVPPRGEIRIAVWSA